MLIKAIDSLDGGVSGCRKHDFRDKAMRNSHTRLRDLGGLDSIRLFGTNTPLALR